MYRILFWLNLCLIVKGQVLATFQPLTKTYLELFKKREKLARAIDTSVDDGVIIRYPEGNQEQGRGTKGNLTSR